MTVEDGFTLADWTNARPMNLRSTAGSVQAIGVVEWMLDELPFPPPKKLLKPSTIEKRRTVLRALLADLLKLEADGVAGYHGMSPKDFPARLLGFSYDVFMPVKDAMVAGGFLDFGGGSQRLHSATDIATGAKGDVVQRGGYQARFRLTRKTLSEVAAAGIALDAWETHWSPPEPIQSAVRAAPPSKPLIELRASKERKGGIMRKGGVLEVNRKALAVLTILADLEEHNAFLTATGVSGVDFVGLRRIFNNGDEPGYRWNKGGRFYSVRTEGMGDAYEAMKGDQRRRRIKLGGKAVGEVDMAASQLRILYALLGEPIPDGLSGDLYAVPDVPRDAVKMIVTEAIGKEGVKSTRWGSLAVKEYRKANGGASLEADYPFAAAMVSTLAGHPILKRLGTGGCPSALELQYVESEVIRRAMAILRTGGVPSLPVHDSLIVPIDSLEEAEGALKDAFQAEIGSVIGYQTRITPKVARKALEVA